MRQPTHRDERFQRRSYSLRQAFGGANYLTSVSGGGLTIPRAGLIFYARNGIDTIGLSITGTWPSVTLAVSTGCPLIGIGPFVDGGSYYLPDLPHNIDNQFFWSSERGIVAYAVVQSSAVAATILRYLRQPIWWQDGIVLINDVFNSANNRGNALSTVYTSGTLADRLSSKGLDIGPARTNLFTTAPSAPEVKSLTAQKYCLQCVEGSVSCSYGTATPSSPLQFTASAGDTTFTPTDCTHWDLKADGGYIFPILPINTSLSNSAASSTNGPSIPTTNGIAKALQGYCTVLIEVYLGVSSDELPTPTTLALLTASNNATCELYAQKGASTYSAKTHDKTNTAQIVDAGWSRDTILKMVTQANASGLRVGFRRYETDGVTPLTTWTWSSYVAYDGSFNPSTFLRFGWVNLTALWYRRLAIWNRGDVGETELNTLTHRDTVIYNGQTSSVEVEQDTSKFNYLFADIKRIHDTVVRAYGYKDGSYESEPLQMYNVATGNVANGASTTGEYRIDTREYSSVKFSNSQSSTNAPVTMHTYWEDYPAIESSITENIGMSFTTYLASGSERITGVQPHCVKNGVVYFVGTPKQIKKTVDFFDTNSLLYTMPADITRITVLDNGNCLCLTVDGKVYLSTDNFTSFNVVIDFGLKLPHAMFGICEYGQYVLLTEYGNSPNFGKKVYLSVDYGVTFNEIFDLDDFGLVSGFHTHSAAYDPYDGLIWVVTGDGDVNKMIFYSSDLGANWHKAANFSYGPTQATVIIPLSDCVLFVSDSRLVSVVRYNRRQNKTASGQALDFDTAVIFQEAWGKDSATEVPIASTPAIDYENSKAYFGYAIVGTADSGSTDNLLKHGEIVATDGYSFKIIYEDAAVVDDGIYGVFADFTASQKIVARAIAAQQDAIVVDTTEVWQ